jgi:hypothetical protein
MRRGSSRDLRIVQSTGPGYLTHVGVAKHFAVLWSRQLPCGFVEVTNEPLYLTLVSGSAADIAVSAGYRSCAYNSAGCKSMLNIKNGNPG